VCSAKQVRGIGARVGEVESGRSHRVRHRVDDVVPPDEIPPATAVAVIVCFTVDAVLVRNFVDVEGGAGAGIDVGRKVRSCRVPA
jgi:hypothetical protein